MHYTAPEKVASTGDMEIIEFEVHRKSETGEIVHDYYGTKVATMREVITIPDKMARSAREHPSIEGVIEIRGEVISVVSLPKWLKVHEPGIKCSRILITEFSGLRAGFMVNRVNRIYRVPFGKVSPPAALARKTEREILTGVVRLKDRMIMLLDFEKVLHEIDPECLADIQDLPHTNRANRGKYVFVVDDSTIMLSILKDVFSKAGYKTISAQNAAEALKHLKALAEKSAGENMPIRKYVAAVSSDLEMPLMEGTEFLAAMKEDEVLKEIPMVFFSSVDSGEKIENLKTLGASAHFQKPDLAGLVEHVNSIT